MFCSICGKKITIEDANFCTSCGTKLFNNQTVQEENNKERQKKKKEKIQYNTKEKEDILSYAESLGITLDRNYVYAYTEPTFKSFFFLGVFSILSDLKNFIIAFTQNEIILFGLTFTGKFADVNVRIHWEDVEQLEVKNGIMQDKITVKSKDESKIVLQVNKRILGRSWQKENLEFLNKNNWHQ